MARYSDDALSTDELHKLVFHRAFGIALTIGGDVSQVANVAVLIFGSTVFLAEGVDYGVIRLSCAPGTELRGSKADKPTVASGAGAAVGVISKDVNVHATLGVGIVSANVP